MDNKEYEFLKKIEIKRESIKEKHSSKNDLVKNVSSENFLISSLINDVPINRDRNLSNEDFTIKKEDKIIIEKSKKINDFVRKCKKNIERQNSEIDEDLPFKKKNLNQMRRYSRTHVDNLLVIEKFHKHENLEIIKKNEVTIKNLKRNNTHEHQLQRTISSNSGDQKINIFGIDDPQEEKIMSKSKRRFSDDYRFIDKMQNVYDSLSDNENNDLESPQIYSFFVIEEKGNLKKAWDFTMIIMIFYSVIIIPLFTTFLNKYHQNTLLIQTFIDFIFMVDILLTFFTKYTDDEDNLISSKFKIFENYFFKGFLLDVVTSVPIGINQIRLNSNLYSNSTSTDIFFQWVKMLRIFKLSKYETISDFKLMKDSKLNSVTKFLLVFLIFVHFSSCFWIFIGISGSNITKSEWIQKFNLIDLDSFGLYLTAMYFNLVTIYTIGYGDITPQNIYETLYCIFLLYIGTNLFSFGISSLSTLFSQVNSKEILLSNKLKLLNEINEEYQIEDNTFKMIKRTIYYEFMKYNNEKYDFLITLPGHIKHELTALMYQDLIKESNFFKDQSSEFVLFVLPFLKTLKANKGEVLFTVGEFLDEIYLVVKGTLSLNLGPHFQFLEIGTMSERSHFGEILIQINQNSPYELRCKSKYSVIQVLKREHYEVIKKAFPSNIMKILSESSRNFESIDKKKSHFIKLYDLEKNKKEVEKLQKKISLYLFDKDFLKYYINNSEIEEVDDFIGDHNLVELLDEIEIFYSEKGINLVKNSNQTLIQKFSKRISACTPNTNKRDYQELDANILKSLVLDATNEKTFVTEKTNGHPTFSPENSDSNYKNLDSSWNHFLETENDKSLYEKYNSKNRKPMKTEIKYFSKKSQQQNIIDNYKNKILNQKTFNNDEESKINEKCKNLFKEHQIKQKSHRPSGVVINYDRLVPSSNDFLKMSFLNKVKSQNINFSRDYEKFNLLNEGKNEFIISQSLDRFSILSNKYKNCYCKKMLNQIENVANFSYNNYSKVQGINNHTTNLKMKDGIFILDNHKKKNFKKQVRLNEMQLLNPTSQKDFKDQLEISSATTSIVKLRTIMSLLKKIVS